MTVIGVATKVAGAVVEGGVTTTGVGAGAGVAPPPPPLLAAPPPDELLPPPLLVVPPVDAVVTLTFADPVPVRVPEVQVRVKLAAVVRAPVDSVPLVALLPVHAPLAVQEVASVDDHVRVEVPPDVTEVGFAEMVTVGVGVTEAGVTAMVMDWVAGVTLPPLQVRV